MRVSQAQARAKRATDLYIARHEAARSAHNDDPCAGFSRRLRTSIDEVRADGRHSNDHGGDLRGVEDGDDGPGPAARQRGIPSALTMSTSAESKAMVTSITWFFRQLQFSGSLGLSLGWGINMVWPSLAVRRLGFEAVESRRQTSTEYPFSSPSRSKSIV